MKGAIIFIFSSSQFFSLLLPAKAVKETITHKLCVGIFIY